MNRLNQLHDQAMEYVDQAFLAKRNGKIDESIELSRKAFRLEVEAANMVVGDMAAEPSRSVLFRSAATLALDINELREAERLIATALSGDPPFEIAEELRDLLEQVNFSRHLSIRNINLDQNELQMSIAGKSIGFGIAPTDTLVGRINDFERLIYRTVERKMGRGFRERGATTRVIQDGYQVYLTAPRPASLSITLRLGRQMQLPGLDLSSEIISEILECFDLLNNSSEEEIKNKIPDEAYYQNFMGLAKRIAPDGDQVNLVGLTQCKAGQEIQVALTRKRNQISSYTKITEKEENEIISVIGRLLLADATKQKHKISLIDEDNNSHHIIVPEGMMDDIVKPLWDDIVIVSGVRIGKSVLLREINRLTD